jgi:hypothetical protein
MPQITPTKINPMMFLRKSKLGSIFIRIPLKIKKSNFFFEKNDFDNEKIINNSFNF